MGEFLKQSDWACEIIVVNNGYKLKYTDPESSRILEDVIEEVDEDELKAGEKLLWWLIDYFALRGGRYDAERLTVTREPGDKYVKPKKSSA
jgi:hypothetical protein